MVDEDESNIERYPHKPDAITKSFTEKCKILTDNDQSRSCLYDIGYPYFDVFNNNKRMFVKKHDIWELRIQHHHYEDDTATLRFTPGSGGPQASGKSSIDTEYGTFYLKGQFHRKRLIDHEGNKLHFVDLPKNMIYLKDNQNRYYTYNDNTVLKVDRFNKQFSVENIINKEVLTTTIHIVDRQQRKEHRTKINKLKKEAKLKHLLTPIQINSDLVSLFNTITGGNYNDVDLNFALQYKDVLPYIELAFVMSPREAREYVMDMVTDERITNAYQVHTDMQRINASVKQYLNVRAKSKIPYFTIK